MQNAAVRLVTGTRRRDHITPVLRQLHWLPVRQRVDFKLALLVYKALHDTTAAYLVDDYQLVSHAGRRRLRSADIDTGCVPRTNTRHGDRSFAATGPRLWNSLPARIRQPDNDIGEFRRQLKSFLPARRYASAGYRDRNVSVCPSVCPSRAGIVSKRRKLAS